MGQVTDHRDVSRRRVDALDGVDGRTRGNADPLATEDVDHAAQRGDGRVAHRDRQRSDGAERPPVGRGEDLGVGVRPVVAADHVRDTPHRDRGRVRPRLRQLAHDGGRRGRAAGGQRERLHGGDRRERAAAEDEQATRDNGTGGVMGRRRQGSRGEEAPPGTPTWTTSAVDACPAVSPPAVSTLACPLPDTAAATSRLVGFASCHGRRPDSIAGAASGGDTGCRDADRDPAPADEPCVRDPLAGPGSDEPRAVSATRRPAPSTTTSAVITTPLRRRRRSVRLRRARSVSAASAEAGEVRTAMGDSAWTPAGPQHPEV